MMPTVTASEAAKLRGVNKSTITRWLASGLKHARFGRQFVIDTRDLAAFVPRAVGNPNFSVKKSRRRK